MKGDDDFTALLVAKFFPCTEADCELTHREERVRHRMRDIVFVGRLLGRFIT